MGRHLVRFWPKAAPHAINRTPEPAKPLRLPFRIGKIPQTTRAERPFEAEEQDNAADLPELRSAI